MIEKKQNLNFSQLRDGYVLLFMLLLIVVIGGFVWWDPAAFFSDKDKGLPWNQERKIIAEDKPVAKPNKYQPVLGKLMMLRANCFEGKEDRGGIILVLNPDGRIQGNWSANYYAKPKLLYEVFTGEFAGNIDPETVYKDGETENPDKLYFITKGKFLILETNEDNDRVRKVSGRVYVTGWIDPEYSVEGKLTITSDKKNYMEYTFREKLVERMNIPLDFQTMPGVKL